MTQWIGEAVTAMSTPRVALSAQRVSKKSGISVALDASEDSEIGIRGISDYGV